MINAGLKIQKFASILLLCGVIGGVVLFWISCTHDGEILAGLGIKESIKLIISSIILYFVICGFGVLVENSEEIKRQNKKIIYLLEKTEK